MSETTITMTKRSRRVIGVLIGTSLLLVAAANWHLVHVAVTSQPDCVAHLRAGSGQSGQFSAAKSSCTPG
jgi:hypothetical protein